MSGDTILKRGSLIVIKISSPNMISYLWLGLGSLIRWAESLLIRSWLPKRLLDWGRLLRWACCLWLLGRELLTDRLGRLLERLPELLGESGLLLLLAERLLGYLLLPLF